MSVLLVNLPWLIDRTMIKLDQRPPTEGRLVSGQGPSRMGGPIQVSRLQPLSEEADGERECTDEKGTNMGKHGADTGDARPAPSDVPSTPPTPIRENGYLWTGAEWIPEPPTAPPSGTPSAVDSDRQKAKTNSYLRAVALVLIVGFGLWLVNSGIQATNDNQNLVCSNLERQAGNCP